MKAIFKFNVKKFVCFFKPKANLATERLKAFPHKSLDKKIVHDKQQTTMKTGISATFFITALLAATASSEKLAGEYVDCMG